MAKPNLALLIAVAQALGDLRSKVVFVGGCARRFKKPCRLANERSARTYFHRTIRCQVLCCGAFALQWSNNGLR